MLSGDPGRSGIDNLNFVNGVLWVLRSGAHWHDLPERCRKQTAHKRFTRWTKAGARSSVLEQLTGVNSDAHLSNRDGRFNWNKEA